MQYNIANLSWANITLLPMHILPCVVTRLLTCFFFTVGYFRLVTRLPCLEIHHSKGSRQVKKEEEVTLDSRQLQVYPFPLLLYFFQKLSHTIASFFFFDQHLPPQTRQRQMDFAILAHKFPPSRSCGLSGPILSWASSPWPSR